VYIDASFSDPLPLAQLCAQNGVSFSTNNIPLYDLFFEFHENSASNLRKGIGSTQGVDGRHAGRMMPVLPILQGPGSKTNVEHWVNPSEVVVLICFNGVSL
jgi:hypothetical protein